MRRAARRCLQKLIDFGRRGAPAGPRSRSSRHSSPISQSGLLFYNTLFDENAACHIALGQCYAKCFRDGGSLVAQRDRGTWQAMKSVIHVDWMIGSAEIDIDGVHADGRRVPVFRKGKNGPEPRSERAATGDASKPVLDEVRASGARSVLDLGCGDGDLLVELARLSGMERLWGFDPDADAIKAARLSPRSDGHHAASRCAARCPLADRSAGTASRFRLRRAAGSHRAYRPEGPAGGGDCAVFSAMRPETVILTTPNSDYNPLLGVPEGRFRHYDHRFEWDRDTFEEWSRFAAETHGYDAVFRPVPEGHRRLGGPSQMGIFRKRMVDAYPRSFRRTTPAPVADDASHLFAQFHPLNGLAGGERVERLGQFLEQAVQQNPCGLCRTPR